MLAALTVISADRDSTVIFFDQDWSEWSETAALSTADPTQIPKWTFKHKIEPTG